MIMKQDNQDKMGNAVLLQSSFPSRLLSLAQLKLKMAERLCTESQTVHRGCCLLLFFRLIKKWGTQMSQAGGVNLVFQ